jgi:Uma2 family endonuclease
VKRELYLSHGIPEYWIANAEGRVVSRWPSLDDPGEVFSSRIELRPAGTDTPLVIDLPALFEDALE